jgi:hypothetical protein
MRDEGDSRALLLGAVAGAIAGSMLALVYRRWNRRREAEGAKPIQTRQVVRLGVSLMPVMRQFLELISS